LQAEPFSLQGNRTLIKVFSHSKMERSRKRKSSESDCVRQERNPSNSVFPDLSSNRTAEHQASEIPKGKGKVNGKAAKFHPDQVVLGYSQKYEQYFDAKVIWSVTCGESWIRFNLLDLGYLHAGFEQTSAEFSTCPTKISIPGKSARVTNRQTTNSVLLPLLQTRPMIFSRLKTRMLPSLMILIFSGMFFPGQLHFNGWAPKWDDWYDEEHIFLPSPEMKEKQVGGCD
jgi:hypothetical protein